jgi:phosphohistidine swiveling domain-containing protein
MLEFDTPSWIEKPSLAIAEIKRMLVIGGVHVPDKERARLRKEGQEIEKELLDKVPMVQREWFGKLIDCAQAAQYFSEDHDYWCEFRCYSLIRRAVMEQARRFVKNGAMDDPEDIHYLFPDDILRGNYLGEVANLRPVVNRNREEHNGYLAHPPVSEEVPLFFGDPSRIGEMLSADPTLAVVLAPRVAEPEAVGATCVGAASAPGVVEGTARVIFSADQWNQIQPGEILVCPMTDATWTPLFGLIKGVVTDAGGTLYHAAIVGREYGIPAVTGCLDATQKIKTGDRIRLDGNLLRVYVL